MKRTISAIVLGTVMLTFPRLAAQRQVFTTGTPPEIALAGERGLEHVRTIGRQRGIAPDSLAVSRTHVDGLSMAHARVQQHLNGVPVLGGEAIAHFRADGELFAETDKLFTDLVVATTPRLTSQEAIAIAVTDYGCSSCLTAPPATTLWVLRQDGVDHLAYRVQLRRMDGTPNSDLPVIFVDAHDGSVVSRDTDLREATGQSLYSGTVNIGTYNNPMFGDFVMENTSNRASTWDLKGQVGDPTTFNWFFFFDVNDVWDSSNQRAAVDAHYGLERFLSYLSTVHGRNGIDGMGGPFFLIGDSGLPMVAGGVRYGDPLNAVWDRGAHVAMFGDGDGKIASPLVTLDIVGHEWTHGVAQFIANLAGTGEPGAVGESWSDVMGSMLERHVRGQSADTTWLMGEQAFTPGTAGDALRYLDDPHRVTSSVFTADDDPDHYSERFVPMGPPSKDNDWGGVHVNAGIPNKAFYLLAQGGIHHLGGSMTGIGADQAQRIWFNALSFMPQLATFADARTATLNAAAALHGNPSTQYEAVSQAWCLVGVGTCISVQAVSVSPASGTGTTQAFTLTYTDTADAADLASARVRFGTSSSVGVGTCTTWYDASTQTIRLMNNDGTWPGLPGVPLSSLPLSNNQCTLNSGTATPTGTTLTLVLNITFQASFGGAKNIYMLAGSLGTPSANTGWLLKGTWTVPGVTTVDAVSVSPASGTGMSQAFTLTYTDTAGAADLASARVRFGTSSSVGVGTCTAWYDASTQTIRLMNNDGTWPALPGVPLSSLPLSNNQCTLNSGTATPTGTTLTLVLSITFQASFAGAKNVYMLAGSLGTPSANTGWLLKGTWTVPGVTTVDAVSVSPASGTGMNQAFTLTYTDTAGAADLASARVRFGTSSSVGVGTCTAWYDASTQRIRLMNNDGTWPALPGVPLSSLPLSNNQCTLNSGTATPTGTTLTLVLNITFQASFGGAKNIYMLAGSLGTPSANTGWLLKGTWTVPGVTTVDAVSVSPASGTGMSQAFTLTYTDTAGAADLASARVRFGTSSSVGVGTCTAWYDASTQTIRLMNNDGTWPALPGVPLSSLPLSNNQCTLNSGTATPTGTTLTLVLNITFSASFAGTKNIYMLAGSLGTPSANTGWLLKGTWTVGTLPGSAYDGSWTGTNSHLQTALLTVANGQITSFATSLPYSGINCMGNTQVIATLPTTISNGSYTQSLTAVSGGSGTAIGTFSSATSMSGSLTVNMLNCLAGFGATSFTATKD